MKNKPKELVNFIEQTQRDDQPTESLILDAEAKEMKSKLEQELQDLATRLNSYEIKQLPFSAPDGEQSIGEQMVALQKEKLPQIFRNTSFDGPYLTYHDIQNEKHSCQLASVSNILKALGLGEEISEQDVAKAIGKSGKVADIWPGELTSLLEERGLVINKIGNTLEAINALLSGSKIVLHLMPPKYPTTHAVIISGVKIDHGKIEFWVNNPQHGGMAEKVPLNVIVDYIIPYSHLKLFPTYAVSKKDPDQGDSR